MKISLTENDIHFFYMACYSSKEIVCDKIANVSGYFLRNGKKKFLLHKIYKVLLANLNFLEYQKFSMYNTWYISKLYDHPYLFRSKLS